MTGGSRPHRRPSSHIATCKANPWVSTGHRTRTTLKLVFNSLDNGNDWFLIMVTSVVWWQLIRGYTDWYDGWRSNKLSPRRPAKLAGTKRKYHNSVPNNSYRALASKWGERRHLRFAQSSCCYLLLWSSGAAYLPRQQRRHAIIVTRQKEEDGVFSEMLTKMVFWSVASGPCMWCCSDYHRVQGVVRCFSRTRVDIAL